ncbi:hypothetical protein NDU88_005353 [Pleurodeles waltl]|uniref:Uncharacterized protein n=1 Tax=Pleurodeles waltl TaxID=8319 RepID=A0AAV7TWD0_PLEWA|nr:hypothetical protein NDU88_005353 [Pleurodeles waltl]
MCLLWGARGDFYTFGVDVTPRGNKKRVKKSAFGTMKEDDEEVEREEEEEKGDKALVGKEERGTSNAERGEWLLPSRGEKDE